MTNKEFELIRSVMNNALRPDKFGPDERIQFVLRINAMWNILLESGTEEQCSFFKKRLAKFCAMYSLPAPKLPSIELNTAELETAIKEVIETTAV